MNYSKENHILDADTQKDIFGVLENSIEASEIQMQKQQYNMYVISDYSKLLWMPFLRQPTRAPRKLRHLWRRGRH
jgi:hypothetical protein